MTLGEKIAKIRSEMNLSQRKFAKLLGLANHQTISKWEEGSRLPSLKTLRKIQKPLKDLGLSLTIEDISST